MHYFKMFFLMSIILIAGFITLVVLLFLLIKIVNLSYLISQINSIDPCIQFTYAVECDNKQTHFSMLWFQKMILYSPFLYFASNFLFLCISILTIIILGNRKFRFFHSYIYHATKFVKIMWLSGQKLFF